MLARTRVDSPCSPTVLAVQCSPLWSEKSPSDTMEAWMTGVAKSRIVEAHEPHWPTVWVWVGFLILFFSLMGVLGWVMEVGPAWLIVPLVLVIAHLMHSHILAFHEAGHRTLCPDKFWNEA